MPGDPAPTTGAAAGAEQYEPLPRNASNQSIEAQNTEASTGRQKILTAGLVIAALCLLGALAAAAVVKTGGQHGIVPLMGHSNIRVKEQQHHLRKVVKEPTHETKHRAHAVVVNKTNTTTQTSTSTATHTTTVTTTHTSTSTSTSTVRDPKLLCFTVMRAHSTDEVALMREQLARGSGIYNCDDWLVLSDTKMWLTPGPPVRLETTVISANLSATGDGVSTKYKNSKQFLRAWENIRENGKYKENDFIVKVDPDAVFFPERLKSHLKKHSGDWNKPKFFANCKTEDHPHFMFGAVELFSTTAAEAYFKHGDRCMKELKSEEMWEERFMSKCLRLLGVHMDTSLDLLQDEHCDGGRSVFPCTADDAVAFHPLRTPSEYFTCMQQAEDHWKSTHEKESHKKEHKDKKDDDEKKDSHKETHAKRDSEDQKKREHPPKKTHPKVEELKVQHQHAHGEDQVKQSKLKKHQEEPKAQHQHAHSADQVEQGKGEHQEQQGTEAEEETAESQAGHETRVHIRK